MGRRRKVNENLIGLTTKRFPYEILVPNFYEICYSGIEGGLSGGSFNNTIEESKINNKDFKGSIWIYNMFPNPTCYDSDDLYSERFQDEAIKIYKFIIQRCNYILLKMNDKNEIENLEVFFIPYFYNNNGLAEINSIELLSDKFPTRDFIALERY